MDTQCFLLNPGRQPKLVSIVYVNEIVEISGCRGNLEAISADI